MTGPEARFQHDLILELRRRGAWVVKYPAGPYGTRGCPDLLVCYRGLFVAIECKRPGAKPTAHQERCMQAIRKAGGVAVIMRPGDDLNVVLTLALAGDS